jgi:maltose alpha-D-glucosyltransferase/alpha-amylase
MFGRSRFPRIGELPYLLTLAPRGFFWFILEKPAEEDETEQRDDDRKAST